METIYYTSVHGQDFRQYVEKHRKIPVIVRQETGYPESAKASAQLQYANPCWAVRLEDLINYISEITGKDGSELIQVDYDN